MTSDHNIPDPPPRLYNDKRILRDKKDCPSCWEARRANKMRERFAVPDIQPDPQGKLVAPVQPSIAPPSFTEIL